MASPGGYYNGGETPVHSYNPLEPSTASPGPVPPPKAIQIDHGQPSYQSGPPPPPLPLSTGSLPSQAGSSFHVASGYDGPDTAYDRPPPNPPMRFPNVEERWLPTEPDLSSYSTAELGLLLQNPAVLTAIAQQHPAYAASTQPLESQIQQNLALAQHLKQLEDQVQTLRQTTSQLMLQHTSLQNSWRRKQTEMDDALSPWSPKAMYQRLISSINEQEALVQAIVESFLEGGEHEVGIKPSEDGFYNGTAVSGVQKASEKEVNDWIRRVREGATTLERRNEMRARWDEGRVGGWR